MHKTTDLDCESLTHEISIDISSFFHLFPLYFPCFFFLVFLAKIAPPSLSLSPFVRLSSFLPSLLCSSLPIIIMIIIIIIIIIKRINNNHHLFKAYPLKKMWLFICESPTKVLQGRQSTRFQKCFP